MLSGVIFTGAEMSQNLPLQTQSLVNDTREQLDPIKESTRDVEQARCILNKHMSSNPRNAEEGKDNEKGELTPEGFFGYYTRMIEWVEKLAALLRNARNDQVELKTALMLAESNLQMALANNEMLEDALKHAGSNVKDIGWRRLSERERLRQTTKEEEELENTPGESSSPGHKPHPPALSSSQTQFAPPQHQPSSSLRFFNFPSLSRTTSPSVNHSSHASTTAEFPTEALSHPHFHSRPSSPASSRLTAREKELSILLDKEREALKSVTAAKSALENELETLSQALFEEANKMVSTSNRKLAEVEEELRTAMEEREALRSALRIVEGENDTLRAKTSVREITRDNKLRLPLMENNEKSSLQQDAVSANYLHLDKSPLLADPVSSITISLVNPDFPTSSCDVGTQAFSGVAAELLLKHGSPQRGDELSNVTPHYSVCSFHSLRRTVMPQTPHTPEAAKNQFEKAMLRMERLIEDVEGNSYLPIGHHDNE